VHSDRHIQTNGKWTQFSADTRWYGQKTVGFCHVLGRDTVEFQDQFFLYVGDGGLGNKHRLSRLGMTLLRRQNEVLVLAPTGNAASNLGRMFKAYWLACCSTGRRRRGPSIRAKSLRANHTMLFIEEIGVSSKLLHSINLQSNVISCGIHVYRTVVTLPAIADCKVRSLTCDAVTLQSLLTRKEY
jgi:hypothetical protein